MIFISYNQEPTREALSYTLQTRSHDHFKTTGSRKTHGFSLIVGNQSKHSEDAFIVDLPILQPSSEQADSMSSESSFGDGMVL